MRPALLSRTLHKWLGLIVGIPIVVWTVSGFYMVVVDLDFIHGDPLVRDVRVPFEAKSATIPFAAVADRFDDVTQVSLRALPGISAPVFDVTTRAGKALVDSASGQMFAPLPKDTVGNLARQYYAGAGRLVAVTLIERDRPIHPSRYGQTAVLWRGGRVIDLGTNRFSSAFGINNKSEVVGFSGATAFYWKDGSLRDLGASPDTREPSSGARDINERGQIAGFSCTGDGCPALRWEPDGRIVVLEDLPGDGENWGGNSAINDSGESVGASVAETVGFRTFTAASWRDNTVEPLDVAPSAAIDINNASRDTGGERPQPVSIEANPSPPESAADWKRRSTELGGPRQC